MKKLILIFVLMSGFAFGQKPNFTPPPKIDGFKFVNDKMAEYLIVDLQNQSKQTIYKKIIEYLKLNYVDFNSVLSASIENEMIRFRGISNGVLNIGNLHENDGLEYLIQIDIQNNKIKVTPQLLKMITEDYRKYELENPLPKEFVSGNIQYDFKDVPSELNRITKKISDYIVNGKQNDW